MRQSTALPPTLRRCDLCGRVTLMERTRGLCSPCLRSTLDGVKRVAHQHRGWYA